MAEIPHPGAILNRDFIEPRGVSYYRLAETTDIPTSRLYEIRDGRRAVTADTALRLERAFPEVNAGFWLALQATYDLFAARRSSAMDYERISPVPSPSGRKITPNQKSAEAAAASLQVRRPPENANWRL